MKLQEVKPALDFHEYGATFQRPKISPQIFRELRKKHGVTLQSLASRSGLTIYTVRLLDEFNEATPAVFDILLGALSDLSGVNYSRATVGEVKFVAKPDLSKVLLCV
jgi:hypothetical protein